MTKCYQIILFLNKTSDTFASSQDKNRLRFSYIFLLFNFEINPIILKVISILTQTNDKSMSSDDTIADLLMSSQKNNQSYRLSQNKP